jgi:chromate transporter
LSEDEGQIWALAVAFALLSFFAVGGVNALIPEMHRQAVDVHGWMSDRRFTDLFAIAQAAPGPNLIIVTLIGWEVGRLPGAAAATLAMLGPTSILTYFVGQIWQRFQFARWRIAIQNGLVPVTIGLVASAAFVLARAADKSIVAALLTLGTAAAVYFTRVHPLLFLTLGAGLGVLGLV